MLQWMLDHPELVIMYGWPVLCAILAAVCKAAGKDNLAQVFNGLGLDAPKIAGAVKQMKSKKPVAEAVVGDAPSAEEPKQ